MTEALRAQRTAPPPPTRPAPTSSDRCSRPRPRLSTRPMHGPCSSARTDSPRVLPHALVVRTDPAPAPASPAAAAVNTCDRRVARRPVLNLDERLARGVRQRGRDQPDPARRSGRRPRRASGRSCRAAPRRRRRLQRRVLALVSRSSRIVCSASTVAGVGADLGGAPARALCGEAVRNTLTSASGRDDGADVAALGDPVADGQQPALLGDHRRAHRAGRRRPPRRPRRPRGCGSPRSRPRRRAAPARPSSISRSRRDRARVGAARAARPARRARYIAPVSR